VGNQQPTTSVASASHSQASCAQLPPPPPLAPAPSHNQQPEGHRQVQQQRDLWEESEARTINSIVPESRHITVLCPSQGISIEGVIAFRPNSAPIQYIFTLFAFIFSRKKTMQEGLTFSLM
jgi:hypothetical protein